MIEPQVFDIVSAKHGEVVNSLNYACQQACDDIRDPNKPSTKARKVTLTIKFEPDENRREVVMTYTVDKKFPAETPHVDLVQISPGDGKAYTEGAQQSEIDFDPVTGEVHDVSPLMRKKGGE